MTSWKDPLFRKVCVKSGKNNRDREFRHRSIVSQCVRIWAQLVAAVQGHEPALLLQGPRQLGNITKTLASSYIRAAFFWKIIPFCQILKTWYKEND